MPHPIIFTQYIYIIYFYSFYSFIYLYVYVPCVYNNFLIFKKNSIILSFGVCQNQFHLNTPDSISTLPLYEGKETDPTRKKLRSFVYDKTGLLTHRSITPAEVAKTLAHSAAVPPHLPNPEWYGKYDEIVADAEAKGIPPAFGRPRKGKVSPVYNTLRW